MSREEAEKLLGGYATGTLTAEEQQALFAAALNDQELFDTLAREQSLRDLLRDPAAKSEVLAALDDVRVPWWRMMAWLRPALAAAAVGLIAVTAMVWTRKQATAPQTATIAEVREPARTEPAPTPKIAEEPPAAPRSMPAARRQSIPPAVKPAKDKQDVAAPPAPAPPPQTAAATPTPAPEEKMKAEKPAMAEPSAQPATPAPTAGPLGFRDSVAAGRGGAAGGGGREFSRLIALDARGLFYGNPGSGAALTGRVTDPANAAIPGAKVTATQPGSDVKFEATTDSSGAYTIPFLPPSNYQISADARGFKRFTGERAVDAESKPQSLDIHMDVGATTETVEITAVPATVDTATAKGSLQTIPYTQLDRKKAPARVAAVSGFAGAPPASGLGVRCSIIRESGGAEPAEVDIGTPLRAGESVKLKVVPNDRGYLRVWERIASGALRAVANGLAQPMRSFEARLPVFPSAGPRQLYVQFSRNALGDGSSVLPALAQQAAGNIVQNVAEGAANATYVVNPSGFPNPQELIVPITLTYR